MSSLEIAVGSTKIILSLKSKPYYTNSNKNVLLFGFPLFDSFDDLSLDNISEKINSLRGYFVFLAYNKNELVLYNDITSGYRLYYYQQDNAIYISDDVQELLITVKREFNDLTFNENEYRYFQKHEYTTGWNTLFNEIEKLPPASYLRVNHGKVIIDSYFENKINTPNYKNHIEVVNNELLTSLSMLKNVEGKKILYFSGGKDSTLLALTLKELKIPFTAILMQTIPS